MVTLIGGPLDGGVVSEDLIDEFGDLLRRFPQDAMVTITSSRTIIVSIKDQAYGFDCDTDELPQWLRNEVEGAE